MIYNAQSFFDHDWHEVNDGGNQKAKISVVQDVTQTSPHCVSIVHDFKIKMNC